MIDNSRFDAEYRHERYFMLKDATVRLRFPGKHIDDDDSFGWRTQRHRLNQLAIDVRHNTLQ